MARNEYYRAIKNTERSSNQAASEAAYQSQLQEQALAEAQRQRDLAEASYRLQAQALNEQRRHQFSIWRQTPDGQAYAAWQEGARQLMADIDDRDAAFANAWAVDLTAQISDADRAAFKTKVYVTPPAAHGWAFYARLIGGGLFILNAVVFVLGHVIEWMFGAHWDGLWALTGWVFWISVALFAIGILLPLSYRSWSRENTTATQAATQHRVKTFGFDLLAEPDRLPAHWTKNTSVRPKLDGFIAASFVEHPSPAEFPQLRMPAVRESLATDTPAVRKVLEWFRAEDVADREDRA